MNRPSKDRYAITKAWPPVDRLPPVDGHLVAEHWQHAEERASPHGWSSEDNWLTSTDDITGLDNDNLY